MIKVEDLCMNYGSIRALDKVSFGVREGEVLGLLGPNGAGKSTTMKILTTFVHPAGGAASVAGLDVLGAPLEVRRLIGYLPETPPLYMEMEVGEYLRFVGRCRGLAGLGLRERLKWVIEHCGLAPVVYKPIRQLSKGYKQRTALGQALIHDPRVLILDEPTSGLDPHQILEIRALIRGLAPTRTIIISTHILQEVEAACDRLVIINEGRIVGDGTLAELRAQTMEGQRVCVGIKAPLAEAEAALSSLEGLTGLKRAGENREPALFELSGPVGADLNLEVGRLARERGWELTLLAPRPFSLEEVFIALTKRVF